MDVIPNEPIMNINIHEKKLLMEAAYYTMMEEHTSNLNTIEIENYLNKVQGIKITRKEIYKLLSSFFITSEYAKEYISNDPIIPVDSEKEKDLPDEETNNESLSTDENKNDHLKKNATNFTSKNINSTYQVNNIPDYDSKKKEITENQINEPIMSYKSRLRPRNKTMTNEEGDSKEKSNLINDEEKGNNVNNSKTSTNEELPKAKVIDHEVDEKKKGPNKEDLNLIKTNEILQSTETKGESHTSKKPTTITDIPEQALKFSTDKKKNEANSTDLIKSQIGARNLKRRLQPNPQKQAPTSASGAKTNRSKKTPINIRETTDEKQYQTRSVTANQGRKLRSRIIKSSDQ